MKVGDLAQTKKGGFGVGPKKRIGIIIDIRETQPWEGRNISTKIVTANKNCAY